MQDAEGPKDEGHAQFFFEENWTGLSSGVRIRLQLCKRGRARFWLLVAGAEVTVVVGIAQALVGREGV